MDNPKAPCPDIQAILAQHGYSLIKKIDEGGFGSVSTVSSTKYQNVTFVAKCMKIPGNKTEIESFNHEIAVLRSVCHPNIVQLYDHFSEDGVFVLILEYCEGGSLDSYLRHSKISHQHLTVIFKEILSGLSALHSMGIAHRDIKPKNILIDKYGRAKLADFGLANFGETGGPKWAGSVCFMAPEIINLANGANLLKADIWSLGITFFVAATGRKPWEGSPNLTVMRRVISNGVQQYPINMHRELRRFLMRILIVDPDERPTCETLLVDPFLRSAAPSMYSEIPVGLRGSAHTLKPSVQRSVVFKMARKRGRSANAELQPTFIL